MFVSAVARVLDNTAECFASVDVRPLAPSPPLLEPERLEALALEGIDTVISLSVEELGPTLTLSLPVLWSGSSVAAFSLRAIHLPTRRVLLDARVARTTGGPFQLRPAAWAEREFVDAFESLLLGAR